MKKIFFFILLLHNTAFSQGLFTGDKKELDPALLLKTIPAIKVWDKAGIEYKLTDYINSNKLYNGKPYLLVLWGSGETRGSQSLSEIAASEIANEYNIVALCITSGKAAIIADRLNGDLSKVPLSTTWSKFLILVTNWDETQKGLYQYAFPRHIFADKQMNIIKVSNVQDNAAIQRIMAAISKGAFKSDISWYTKEGNIVTENEPAAYYFFEYKADADNIKFKAGTKSKVLSTMGYLRKNNEYLYNGILDVKNEKGLTTASGNFKEGVPVEPFKSWYESGKIRSIYPVNGTYKIFDEAGKITYEGPVSNGLGNGLFTAYGEGGKKTAEYNYKSGKLSGLQVRYFEGDEKQEWFESPDYETNNSILQEGLQPVQKHGLWGYVDRTGKIIIPFKYKTAAGFKEGLAAVSLGELYGYIDKTGQVTIPIKYDYASDFKDGKAMVRSGSKSFSVDKKGKLTEDKE